ncbi:MAG: hypothetical protein LUF04_07035 [Bacteroides sp.]|nr:hypothetical protein [Bacteroides sp.]
MKTDLSIATVAAQMELAQQVLGLTHQQMIALGRERQLVLTLCSDPLIRREEFAIEINSRSLWSVSSTLPWTVCSGMYASTVSCIWSTRQMLLLTSPGANSSGLPGWKISGWCPKPLY